MSLGRWEFMLVPAVVLAGFLAVVTTASAQVGSQRPHPTFATALSRLPSGFLLTAQVLSDHYTAEN